MFLSPMRYESITGIFADPSPMYSSSSGQQICISSCCQQIVPYWRYLTIVDRVLQEPDRVLVIGEQLVARLAVHRARYHTNSSSERVANRGRYVDG